ncbi:protoporphyrinogen oxidase [Marinitenerispora sediminis]|uniref:Coproporphyrinogen III oxidase n=1 Tax=Marinitenerispora sediminis TaxID=1931232 RepID=A0A368T7R9_9ACTN|nr:protoporphyrinogen oxidase [Marinitenerispora sediminis]RCV52470.1 protoporphyrinogen oxidase [Marinitenerispora sediminis]RCV60215.1 protoporphyrinogen oxidase [Marinitenerispora sediminis]RCV62197.1 protoporphyrinogen oxidase [Marinitenerispora sediminis]
MQTKPHVAVVGGGVAGLTAAYRLSRAGHWVTVLEAAPRLGGKLDASTVAGVPVDAGAESVLARRPEALDLMHELGLTDRIVHPSSAAPRVYSRGALRPLPDGHVMGVPGDLAALARSGVLSPAGLLRAARDLVWPRTPVRADVPVAAYVGVRMGAEVVDRLVEPMLGGVYAGRADRLSLDETLPQLAPLARTERSLAAAVRAVRDRQAPAAGAPPRPVFAGLRGGLTQLVDALAKLGGAEVRTSAPVRELRRDGAGWTLTTGPEDAPAQLSADAVVLACPAPEAARLLRAAAPQAAAELTGIEYAGMAIATFAYRASAFPAPPDGSGFLVPAGEGRTIKAATFSSVKWPWLAEALSAAHPDEDLVVVRCSIGRFGDDAALRRPDEELADLAAADLAAVCGLGEPPVDQRISRWEPGLPQYAVGHAARVARARAALAGLPGLALCGAAYDGVGIPACIAGGTAAAARIAAG